VVAALSALAKTGAAGPLDHDHRICAGNGLVLVTFPGSATLVAGIVTVIGDVTPTLTVGATFNGDELAPMSTHPSLVVPVPSVGIEGKSVLGAGSDVVSDAGAVGEPLRLTPVSARVEAATCVQTTSPSAFGPQMESRTT